MARPVIRWMCTSIVVVVTVACSRVSPNPTTEKPMLDTHGKPLLKPPLDVHLACTVERTGAPLHVRFLVTNAAKEPIDVFDDRGRGDFQPNILCDGGGGAVHVLFGVPALPPFPVYMKHYPKATTLIPGASVRRDSAVAIPLRERGTYYPTAYSSHGSVDVGRLGLRVDFLRASQRSPKSSPDEPWGVEESVSCEVALPGPIELQRRDDAFDRF